MALLLVNYDAAKLLARLVSGIPDRATQVPYGLFYGALGTHAFFSLVSSWVVHTSATRMYNADQEARLEYRKERRLAKKPRSAPTPTFHPTVVPMGEPSGANNTRSPHQGGSLVEPLLLGDSAAASRTGVDAASSPLGGRRPSQASVTSNGTADPAHAAVSEHESDDDSSSDEDEVDPLIEGDIENVRYRTVSAAELRASERRRRVRQRRRKKRQQQKLKIAPSSGIMQLLRLAVPDVHYFAVAFVALILAALASAIIPRFTGQVINHLTGENPDRDEFHKSIMLLTLAAVSLGIFSGIRGALFTITMARMEVRIRRTLFKRVMEQEQGFFDETKVGEITSRLASDTTKMSDQISLNVNVLLRSLVEAAIVLVLMFQLSWKLTLLSFISLPVMTIVSKYYGAFYRSLAKRAQDSLADANSVAEEALSQIQTVRDFHAAPAEFDAYSDELDVYYYLNRLESMAYAGFVLTWTTIPALVTALTLWVGGTLVLQREPGEPCGSGGSLCGGDLVSFMLYSQNLSNSFNALGSIASGIASALGAADKVFVLMNREPKIPPDGTFPRTPEEAASFKASLELRNVRFSYPSRPGAVVLKGVSIKVEPGECVALVGASGGGK